MAGMPRFLEGGVPAPISCIGGRTLLARRPVDAGIIPKSSSWSVSMQVKGGGIPDSSSYNSATVLMVTGIAQACCSNPLQDL